MGGLCLHAFAGDARSPNIQDSRPKVSLTASQAVERIRLIEYLVPKSGERQTDPHAAAIIASGRQAAPWLLEKLLDDTKSRYFYEFQYKIGDIAHALLREIYHTDPSQSLMARNPPLRPEEGYTYRDYVALVSSTRGRQELQAAWEKVVRSTGQK